MLNFDEELTLKNMLTAAIRADARMAHMQDEPEDAPLRLRDGLSDARLFRTAWEQNLVDLDDAIKAGTISELRARVVKMHEGARAVTEAELARLNRAFDAAHAWVPPLDGYENLRADMLEYGLEAAVQDAENRLDAHDSALRKIRDGSDAAWAANTRVRIERQLGYARTTEKNQEHMDGVTNRWLQPLMDQLAAME